MPKIAKPTALIRVRGETNSLSHKGYDTLESFFERYFRKCTFESVSCHAGKSTLKV